MSTSNFQQAQRTSHATSSQTLNSTKDGPIRGAQRQNGKSNVDNYDDIPENMYRPETDHPEGWIHRDKLAKIESEELQAAGINLANARSRSRSRIKSVRSTSSTETESKREEHRQRLEAPAEIEDEIDRASWDFRLPEEIEEEQTSAASQMYANPVLRKSGSKIPVMTSSPMPIPPERYERETPIARKRTASGTISIDGDLNLGKLRAPATELIEENDSASSVANKSSFGSPQKQRASSGLISSPSGPKKTAPAIRKVSAPTRSTPSPTQRPSTRSGEQERPRTSHMAPEGDPPWLATMYKPDPMLPQDQQLIPTLAKKQMQAQWAAEGAVPKTYDREFTPIDVHDIDPARSKRTSMIRSQSPVRPNNIENINEPAGLLMKPLTQVTSNGRPGTAGSLNGGYSTMPKVIGTPNRDSMSRLGSNVQTSTTRPLTNSASQRMQAINLTDDDEKVKKGCCCLVM